MVSIRKISHVFVLLLMLFCCSVASASVSVSGQVNVGIGLPNLNIGINLSTYPQLAPVPGYPVYYAPQVAANYFFYDGMYWVYLDDRWYASYWYNGPWSLVEPLYVPLYILRIPVRYYRLPPAHFRGWHLNEPPRWGQHWGREWEQQRRGWDKWKRGSTPARAPLPSYQREYRGDRYPRQVEQQQQLRSQHYNYQSRDREVRQHFERYGATQHPAPAQLGREKDHRMRSPAPQDMQRPLPPQQRVPPDQRPQPQIQPQQPRRDMERMEQHERQMPRPQGQEQRMPERDWSHEQRGHGQEQRQDTERGRGR